MDLLLQSGKAGGIPGELFRPEVLLSLKLRMNRLKGLPSRRNGLARLGTKTEEHRTSLRDLIISLSILPERGLNCTFWVGARAEFVLSIGDENGSRLALGRIREIEGLPEMLLPVIQLDVKFTLVRC